MPKLIGVTHKEEKLIQQLPVINRHVNGRDSIMLELPPHWEQNPLLYGYFGLLGLYFKETNHDVIAGDLARKKLEQEIISNSNSKNLITQNKEIDRQRAIMKAIIKGIFIAIKDLHPRNKNLLKTYEEKKPEVTIVGHLHANYLKKKHPELEYISLIDKERKNIFFKILQIIGFIARPDQEITLLETPEDNH